MKGLLNEGGHHIGPRNQVPMRRRAIKYRVQRQHRALFATAVRRK